MANTTNVTTKKRTQVKDIPVPSKEMTKEEKGKIRGGAVGPCNKPPKTKVN